jgi:DNA-binding transcriptional regulator GbsR (MarR family)
MKVGDRMPENAKNEFIELIAQINRAKGLDELTSKMIGILFIEPREVSLEQLSEQTGYSLSAVSTAMKLLTGSGLIKRVKKPGSRKVYFFMEKDFMGMLIQSVRIIANNISVLKARMPGIIERYKKGGGSKEELRIIEKHYKMVREMDCMMEKITGMIKEAHAKYIPKK